MARARCNSTELIRLRAVDGDNNVAALPEWGSSIVIRNYLTTPVYGAWRRTGVLGAAPSPVNGFDWAAPGSATTVVAIPSDADWSHVAANVYYNGAVPGSDAGLYVMIDALETQQTPGATPLA